MTTDRLSPLDTSFLRMETPEAHMHVAWRGRFEPSPGAPPITLKALRRQVAGRLEHAPRFRQKLAPTPGGLAEPLWIDDEDFRVERHVTALSDVRGDLPLGRFDELADFELSIPLPRDRPLWTLRVAPKLEDGSVGVLMKVHHAMVDGMSAVALAMLLLDARREVPAPDQPAAEWVPEPTPGGAELLLGALADAAAQPVRIADRMVRMALSVPGRSKLAETVRSAALSVGQDLLSAAPPSFLNHRIGPRRTLVGHRLPLDGLLAVKRARDVSLNDVALTVVAGALRRIAVAGGRVPAPLKVMVPVSRRTEPDSADPGNQIAFVFVNLPVNLERPLDRLGAVRAETQAFKTGERAVGGEAVFGALGLLPGPLQARAAEFVSSSRMYNLVVSNIPGPRFPVYMLGAECVEVLPVVPLSQGHALSIGMFSLEDSMCFSGYADPDALPEVMELPAAIDASMAELASL